MKYYVVQLDCDEIDLTVKNRPKSVKKKLLTLDMKRCVFLVDAWELKIKDIQEGGLMWEHNTLTLKGKKKEIVCVVKEDDYELEKIEDFVENKIVPTVARSKEKENAKNEDYNPDYSPPPAKFGRQNVAKGYGQKTKAFHKTLANVERDNSAAFSAAAATKHSTSSSSSSSPSSTSSSSIDDPALFSPNDKSIKAIEHRERIRAKLREREERSKKKRKSEVVPSPENSPPSSVSAPVMKKKLKLSSPDATSTPLNSNLSNSVLNDPIQDSDDEGGSVSSGASGPRRLNFGSSKSQPAGKLGKKAAQKNVRFEETEEAKKSRIEANSNAALKAMLVPTNKKEQLMEMRRRKKAMQSKDSLSSSPAPTKMPINPYVKSTSGKNFVRSNSALFTTTTIKSGGLTNIGNSCYMNAVIQCLLSIPSFVKEMKGGELKKLLAEKVSKEGAEFPLHDAFLQLAETRDGRYGDAKVLKSTMDKLGKRFRGNSQQDAHEFLSDFIDFLAEEFDQKKKAEEEVAATPNDPPPVDSATPVTAPSDSLTTPLVAATPAAPPSSSTTTSSTSSSSSATSSATPSITPSNSTKSSSGFQTSFCFPTEKCFEASVDVKLCCNKCGWARSKVEYYRHFSVDVEENLGTAMDKFFKSEVLEIDCEKCSGKEATQTKTLSKVPGALVLHLKRFIAEGTDSGQWKYRKVQDQVAFGSSASLTKYMGDANKGKEANFKLKSVVHHIGKDAGSGHYVTDAVGTDGKWTNYNDSVAKPTSATNVMDDVGKKTAYILCYEVADA